MAERTYLQAISDGLRQEMQRDKRVFVIGEDVGVYAVPEELETPHHK